MRLLGLKVRSFRCVRQAEVSFGPALNVLHGPNDHGKSTLAEAIRAALLVPSSGAEAERFRSWYEGAPPQVELTFTTPDGRYWRVCKTFGRGSQARSELLHSKDGRTYDTDCQAREVDEKLRKLWRWGIATPGGTRGGPRGVPESFLTNVLLATQTGIEEVLSEGLAKDADDSGKKWLAGALATLAEHPLFKAVLAVARVQRDEYFTPTGRLRRTQGSQLVTADEQIKEHTRALDELRRALASSAETEHQVRSHREALELALTDRTEAETRLRNAREGLKNSTARSAAEQRVSAASQELEAVDQHAAQFVQRKAERAQAVAQVTLREAMLNAAGEAVVRAQGALRAAEESHRSLLSDEGEQRRRLRASQLQAEAAELAMTVERSNNAREQASAAKQAKVAVAAAEQQRTAQEQSLEVQRTKREQGERAVADAEAELSSSRALLAFGRLQAARQSAAEAEAARKRCAELQRQAVEKERQATEGEQRCVELEEQLTARRACLPDRADLMQLHALDRERDVAKAALGGGLHVVLRPMQPITVRAEVDGKAAVAETSRAAELLVDAERSVRLALGDLAEVEVTAGSMDAREAHARIQARWDSEVVPLLHRGKASSLADLTERVDALAKEGHILAERRRAIDDLRRDARGLFEQAATLAGSASKAVPTAEEIHEKERAVGGTAPELLRDRLAKMGKNWETAAEAERDRADARLTELRSKLAKHDTELSLARAALNGAEQRVAELQQALQEAASRVEGDPEVVIARLDKELADAKLRSTGVQEELAALASEASAEQAQAEAALVEARSKLGEAERARTAVSSEVDEVRATVHRLDGQLADMELQLAQLDRPSKDARVHDLRAALAALPAGPLASQAEVDDAEEALRRVQRLIDERREALHKAEGALSKVGGAQLRDRVLSEQEALHDAKMREKLLTDDANAWRLLHQALRDAEAEEGAHLGRALSGPVGERFAELTRGRYRNLRFDQQLCAEGLEALGTTDSGDSKRVLDALSVGTRDQLATLMRLTIASQLKCLLLLDDHLVHTDTVRIEWFRDILRRTSVDAQVIVFTCRPEDYFDSDPARDGGSSYDLDGGVVRVLDLGKLLVRYEHTREREAPVQPMARVSARSRRGEV